MIGKCPKDCWPEAVVVKEHTHTRVHTHTFVFSCRADRQGMGVPYSLEDSSGWPVCCLPAAYTPAIHLLLPGPLTPLPKYTHTLTHSQIDHGVCVNCYVIWS